MEIIKLNLIPSGVNPICHAKQYDEGRIIRFMLFDGLTPYTLQSGDTVTLNLRKPDNTIIESSVTATQGNKYVDLVTTEQICAVAGYNLGTFKITNGSVEIGTLNFIMEVGKDVLANGIPSQSVIEDLDALVAEAVGDNYYNKTQTDEKIAALIDDTQVSANKTYSSYKIDTLLNDIDEILYTAGGNLFDKDNPNVINGYFSAGSPTITADAQRKCIYIPIDPSINANVIINKTVSSSVLRIGYTTTEPAINTVVNDVKSSSDQYRAYLLDNSARYLVVYLYSGSETNSFTDIINGLVVEYGTTPRGYVPYKIINPMLQTDMHPFLMSNFMKTAKTPIITLTVDGNNNLEGLDSFHNLCETLGIKCTYACLTYLIDPEATGYNENVLTRFRTWLSEGYHITTESQTHGEHWATATLDVDECEKDVIRSLIILRQQGFVDYEYLCTPDGQRAPAVQKMCKKWCNAMITGGSLLNTFYDDGRFNIHRVFIVSDASGGLGLEGYKSLVDNCYNSKGWLVFGVHTNDSTEYDPILVSNVIQYAITKGCDILPLNQAFKIKQPIYNWGECFN